MEDSYSLLLNNKLEGESFSEEIRRVFSEKKKRSLKDFFGILSEEEGDAMMKGLELSREIDLKLEKKRLK